MVHGSASTYKNHGCHCDECRVAYNEYHRVRRVANKAKLLELFGSKCKNCGFDDPRALQLDHVKGDGYLAAKGLRSGSKLYAAVLRGTLPQASFQLLCANCNWIKRHENGEY
jgi:hypothetical protein